VREVFFATLGKHMTLPATKEPDSETPGRPPPPPSAGAVAPP